MSDLVHGLVLLARQLALLINGLLLQEVPNLVARGQEILVADMVIISSSELCLASTMYQTDAFRRLRVVHTNGWSSMLNSSSSCFARASIASVSSALKKLGRRR